jgi:hypothetical protein
MRKTLVCVALVSLCACNLLKKSDATDSEGGTAAAASASSGSGGGVVSKGLSFLTGGPMQGEMDILMKSEKSNGTMKLFAKGTKQRVEMNMNETGASAAGAPKMGAMIMDDVKKEMILLDDEKKTAMIMKLDAEGKPSTPGGPSGTTPTKADAPECKPTGKSDTVAGYDCNICVTEAADSKTEACIANGLSFLGVGGKSSFGALAGKAAGFPLRAVKTAKSDGHEIERMEVTKIERKNIGDDKFQIPPGYKTMDMAEMFKGLGGPPHH